MRITNERRVPFRRFRFPNISGTLFVQTDYAVDKCVVLAIPLPDGEYKKLGFWGKQWEWLV